MRSRILVVSSLATTFLLGFGLACYVNEKAFPSRDSGQAVAELRLFPEEERQVQVFRDAHRSVVNISNIATVRRRRGFFDYTEEEVPRGTGSGIVWDKEGHIVTNFHVVMNASSILVTLADQSAFEVKEIVGVYADKDIAILRIDAPPEKLHPVKRGRSSGLVEGMKALAIGNPFGLDQTLTVGTISALGRTMRAPNGRRIADVIQTDAPVNRGNSGGPLLNLHGELIGINTAILSPSGANAGIAFAVPIDAVKRVVGDFVRHGKYLRPGLGVELWPDVMAQRLDYDGVMVKVVGDDTAAARSGLRGTKLYTNGEVELGDVIVAIDGEEIHGLNDLLDTLEKHDIGDTVRVDYVRDGRKRSTEVTLQKIEIE